VVIDGGLQLCVNFLHYLYFFLSFSFSPCLFANLEYQRALFAQVAANFYFFFSFMFVYRVIIVLYDFGTSILYADRSLSYDCFSLSFLLPLSLYPAYVILLRVVHQGGFFLLFLFALVVPSGLETRSVVAMK